MSTLLDLVGLFDTLPSPAGPAHELLRFETASLPGHSRYRLGRRADNSPALLIASTSAGSGSYGPPLQLESITVHPRALCRIGGPGGEREGTFAVICYTGRERDVEEYFLRILPSLIASLGDEPTATAVSDAIEHLVTLFRSLAQPPRKSVQGLWAELLLIANAVDPVALVGAWHVSPDDRHDFNAGEQRLEIKSTSMRLRRHHFSLEQLRPPAATDLIIGSSFVERAASGCSVKGMLDEIERRLSAHPEAQQRVRAVAAAVLGRSLSVSLEMCFDRQLAEDSWRWYGHSDVPTISCPIGKEISEVRFAADLSGAPVCADQELTAAGGLFAAAVRR